MTIALPRSRGPGDFGPRPLSWGACLGALCVPAIWIFASYYTGIDGDARIYMARALADLDPNGVGRDIMFALDGQSAFTIFRVLAAKLVASLGPANAALALALLNMAAWFAAMTALASRFASGRALAVLLVCAAVLPCSYGFYPLMGSREIIAVPRPLSEAGVLFALAALCAGRVWLALALLGAAALLHPIMALPGFAVVFLVQGRQDRRWFVALALGLAAAAVAALAGLPLFVRLTTVIDAPWRALLEDRNPYLFVSHWHAASFSPLAVQSVSVALGGLLTSGRRRAILFAALAVACAGVAAGWLLGDGLSLLLAVQVQPWRALWLVAVLAMPAFGLCLIELPKRGPSGQIALGLLVFAWITFDTLPASPLAALLALALFVMPASRPLNFSRSFVVAIWIILLAMAIALKWQDAALALEFVRSMPATRTDMTGPLWRAGVLPWPFVLVAVAWARWPGTRFETLLAASLLVLLALLIALTWDARSPASKRVASNVHDAVLERMTASKPGEVLWLNGDEEWYWLGRPQWITFTHGAGIVFSRPLAMLWSERMKLLISLGLADEGRLRPWRAPAKIVVPVLTASALAALCTRQDAPAWIVSPLPAGWSLPPGLGGSIWHAPVTQGVEAYVDQRVEWYAFDSYAVVACAGNAALKLSSP